MLGGDSRGSNSPPASRIPGPTVVGGGLGSCFVRSNWKRGNNEHWRDRYWFDFSFWWVTTQHYSFIYSTFSHKELLLTPHQLSLAPADAVAGNAAEVAAPRNLDLGPCCALFLMLWFQHHQEAVWEILLWPHLHIHPDQDQNFIKHTTHTSQMRRSLFTLRSVPREAEELYHHDRGRCWCSPFPRTPCATASVNPALSHPGQKRAALSQSPSAWWRTLPDKAAFPLEVRAEVFLLAAF